MQVATSMENHPADNNMHGVKIVAKLRAQIMQYTELSRFCQEINIVLVFFVVLKHIALKNKPIFEYLRHSFYETNRHTHVIYINPVT